MVLLLLARLSSLTPSYNADSGPAQVSVTGLLTTRAHPASSIMETCRIIDVPPMWDVAIQVAKVVVVDVVMVVAATTTTVVVAATTITMHRATDPNAPVVVRQTTLRSTATRRLQS